mmetsp:Transcript_37353/g.76643  ORF Transcript_37353/g.76643 Transcript_37353/m.76643 type:complete len:113 (+) Transcript_37353:59-397(+)
MVCLCCTADEEKQMLGCILLHYQCGCFPCKMCDYDNDGMCWGCVCCQLQIDPCWGPRQVLHVFCACVPCGCIGKEFIFWICCCNPGKETADPTETHKAAMAAEEKAHPSNQA